MEKLYITSDLETTGLLFWRHGICQIGAVATSENGAILDTFSMDVNPGNVEIDQEAINVNLITLERIKAGVPINRACQLFFDWVTYLIHKSHIGKNTSGTMENIFANHVMYVGHNTPFDIPFLVKAFTEAEIPTWLFRRCLDTISLGYDGKNIPMQRKLGERYKIPNLSEHDALKDAMQCSQIFHKLLVPHTQALILSNV